MPPARVPRLSRRWLRSAIASFFFFSVMSALMLSCAFGIPCGSRISVRRVTMKSSLPCLVWTCSSPLHSPELIVSRAALRSASWSSAGQRSTFLFPIASESFQPRSFSAAPFR